MDAMIKEQTTNVQLNVRCLPPDVRSSFHRWCTARGASMEHAVRQIIEAITSGELTPIITDDNAVDTAGAVALNIRCLHYNLRRHFKSWCVLRGVSMEHAVRQIIEAVVAGRIVPRVAPDR